MPKRPEWKQDTPSMQEAALMQAIVGWQLNREEGINPEKAAKEIARYQKQLEERIMVI